MDYQTYRELIDALMAEGKTTGNHQSAAMEHYTKMNVQRMRRLDKTTKLNESLLSRLKTLDKKYIWLVITEAWCGDAAQILPILHAISKQHEHIKLSLLLRDEHLTLMDAYLTDGSRSIPKLIAIDAESGEEIGTWGPRPADAHQLVLDYKADSNRPSYMEFSKTLQLWYAKDRGVSIQSELLEKLNEWEEVVLSV